MNKAILFNAPKATGKDVAINYLMENLTTPLVRRECKDLLHKLTQLFFCVSEERYWEIYNDRSLKEVPLPEFTIYTYWDWRNGFDIAEELGYDVHLTTYDSNDIRYNPESESDVMLSIREAMIYVSEIICKPRFGESYFGKARAASIKEGEVIVDGSCGFVEELQPLIDRIGNENILLIRVHREGFTFEGDSRNYIPDGVLDNVVDVYNNGTEQEYFEHCLEIVKGFLNE